MTHSGRGRSGVQGVVLAVAFALMLAGCSSAPEALPSPEVTGGFGSCEGLNSGTPPGASARVLPAVQLPCFDGRSVVHVDQIKGPAVINLWASWCEPCRAELPAFARLAAKPGAPKVIGVVDTSTRSAAASLATDLGLTFPTLFDEKSRLNANLSLGAVPATLFIDEQGRITHIYRSVALTDETLGALVESYL